MASRGGGGAIVVAGVAGVLALAFFVAWLFVLGRLNEARTAEADAQEALATFIRSNERDAAARYEAEARDQRESVFSVMNARLSDMTELVAGTDGATPDEVLGRVRALSEAPEAGGDAVVNALTRGNDVPLLQLVQSLALEVADLQTQLAEADAARRAAVRSFNEQSEFVASERGRFNREQQQLQGLVDRYVGDVETQLQTLESESREMRDRIDDARALADAEKAELQAEIADLNTQILTLRDQLRTLRGTGGETALLPTDEFALVDGEIISVNATDRSVIINRGRRDKAILGMTFAVYDDATAIRPDASGTYPRGKARLEITNVGENSSTARILEETRGNPIVRGDVIANAVWDPNKQYKLVVYGTFDTNGDGQFTQFERDNVVSLIRDWGGEVVDDLQGDVDFVVLGRKPALPPRPSSAAPPEVQQRWIDLNRIVDRYDEYQRRAEETRVPVLNYNRLLTLTGGG